MKTLKTPQKKETSSFGKELLEALKEVKDWKEGKIALEVVRINPMPAAQVKAIRKKVAKSTREFEERFGIPASTMNNWEQGRREPDLAARLLLKVIAFAPEAVEKAARTEILA